MSHCLHPKTRTRLCCVFPRSFLFVFLFRRADGWHYERAITSSLCHSLLIQTPFDLKPGTAFRCARSLRTQTQARAQTICTRLRFDWRLSGSHTRPQTCAKTRLHLFARALLFPAFPPSPTSDGGCHLTLRWQTTILRSPVPLKGSKKAECPTLDNLWNLFKASEDSNRHEAVATATYSQ